MEVPNIDWDLLHQQKCTILALQYKNSDNQYSVLTETENIALDGIVALLDALQDQAEIEGLWKFPEPCPACGGSGREYETIEDDTPCHVCKGSTFSA